MPPVDLLSVTVHAASQDDFLAYLHHAVTDDARIYISMCTVYTLMKARDNPRVRQALEDAAFIAADGVPLVWLQKLRGYTFAERIYGPDIMQSLCCDTPQHPYTHYFYGGAAGVAEALAHHMQACYPRPMTIHYETPPRLETDKLHIDWELVERLNNSDADIIWVGLGSPKQDVWMQLYRPVLTAPVLIGVGAAFDFLSRRKPQAPRWMQRSGLEWLFRLLSEPRRLWRRYLVYNTRFLLCLLRECLADMWHYLRQMPED